MDASGDDDDICEIAFGFARAFRARARAFVGERNFSTERAEETKRASFRTVRGEDLFSACRNRGSRFPRNREAGVALLWVFLRLEKGGFDGTADGTRS